MPSSVGSSHRTLHSQSGKRLRVWRLALRCLRAQRYPRYLVDLCATYVMPMWFKPTGLNVGKGTTFAGFPIISLAAGSSIAIGRRCRLVSRASATALGVNHPVVLRTMRPGAVIRLGDGVRASGVTICAGREVSLGARCVIGANVTIVDTDFHALDPHVRSSAADAEAATSRPVMIGNDVFIGGGSFILKGVCIGDCAVVGAATVVTRAVAPRTIVAGNPARVVGQVP